MAVPANTSVWQLLVGPYGELVVDLVRSHPAGLYKTAVAKLTYLIDLEHFHRSGASLTGAAYRRQERGPLAIDLFRCNALDRHELLLDHGPAGGIIFKPGLRPRFDPAFSKVERYSIDAVLERFPNPNDIEGLTAAAYATGPMKRVLADEKPLKGAKLLGHSLDFQDGD